MQLGLELGWAAVGIADIALEREAEGYQAWIAAGHHGEMEYMARHGSLRWQPDDLQPGTQSVICVALDYWPQRAAGAEATLQSTDRAYVSRYALGRDYHKVLRNKLQAFAERIGEQIAAHDFRVFTDSAPVMEIPLAVKAGLGWRGKHTLLLNRERGSLFFLGEIYTSLLLAQSAAQSSHCGSCTACIDVCPTRAITAPHRLDARRCISYLTIELKDSIPQEFAGKMDGWAFGCDVCQQVCPWNRFATPHSEPEFAPKPELLALTADEWHGMTEVVFDRLFEGSAVKRAKFAGLQRTLRFLRSGA